MMIRRMTLEMVIDQFNSVKDKDCISKMHLENGHDICVVILVSSRTMENPVLNSKSYNCSTYTQLIL